MDSFRYQLASELIQQIYYSVSHSEGWQATVAAIARAHDADGCALWLSDVDDPDVGMMATTLQDQDLLTLYKERYAATSPHFQRLKELPFCRMYTSEQLVPREELMRTPVYREYWKAAGIEYSAGGFITREKSRVAVIWVYRHQGPPFSGRELEMLEFLRPHLAQALTIRTELLASQTVARTGMQALDRMSMGMILLDEHGRPVAYNACTAAFIKEGVLSIGVDGLQLTGAENSRRLLALVDSTASPDGEDTAFAGGGFKLASVSAGNGGIEVLVLPYRPAERQESLMAPVNSVVFVKHAGSAPIPREQLLRDLYAMTAAEVRVCLALLDGGTIKEIAEEQGVSLDAVRFHSKNILRKTGSSRQSDLIRTLSLSVINLAGS